MNGQNSEGAETIGWDAIDNILKEEYGEQVPQHYAPKVCYSLGGNEPLGGCRLEEKMAAAPRLVLFSFILNQFGNASEGVA